jgi:hypothetical protein
MVVKLSKVGRIVDTDDLIDAAQVARILGLRNRNSTATYLARYPDMPRPVVDYKTSQIRLWLRSEVEVWNSVRHRARH